MAEGDNTFRNHFKAELFKGKVDLDGDTFKVQVVNATPDIDTWDNEDDITGEISATGNTTVGKSLASLLVMENDTNDRAEWDFADVTWTNLATATINNAVVYLNTGVAATSIIVGWVAISTNSNGGDYTLQINANGFAHLS